MQTCSICSKARPADDFGKRHDGTTRAICIECVDKHDDSRRLDWLQEQLVDTIYLDDGRIVDVRGGDLRKAIDEAQSQ
jgi:hypothetical protein